MAGRPQRLAPDDPQRHVQRQRVIAGVDGMLGRRIERMQVRLPGSLALVEDPVVVPAGRGSPTTPRMIGPVTSSDTRCPSGWSRDADPSTLDAASRHSVMSIRTKSAGPTTDRSAPPSRRTQRLPRHTVVRKQPNAWASSASAHM